MCKRCYCYYYCCCFWGAGRRLNNTSAAARRVSSRSLFRYISSLPSLSLSFSYGSHRKAKDKRYSTRAYYDLSLQVYYLHCALSESTGAPLFLSLSLFPLLFYPDFSPLWTYSRVLSLAPQTLHALSPFLSLSFTHAGQTQVSTLLIVATIPILLRFATRRGQRIPLKLYLARNERYSVNANWPRRAGQSHNKTLDSVKSRLLTIHLPFLQPAIYRLACLCIFVLYACVYVYGLIGWLVLQIREAVFPRHQSRSKEAFSNCPDSLAQARSVVCFTLVLNWSFRSLPHFSSASTLLSHYFFFFLNRFPLIHHEHIKNDASNFEVFHMHTEYFSLCTLFPSRTRSPVLSRLLTLYFSLSLVLSL